MNLLLDQGKLEWDAREQAQRYQGAVPFPHIVIDDFLPLDAFRRLCGDFPGPEDRLWFKFQSGAENLKLQSQDFYAIPDSLRALITELNGPAFVNYLQDVSGIQGLIPDPHLYGGGLHQTLPGGHLGVHVDYNFHTDWKLDRRLNVIYYLNEAWEDDWGGHLELWDKEVKERVQRIAPKGNRLVIFNTDEYSWHGHPDPLACPEGKSRRSIALYYYSNGRPESERAASHNTIFKERPGEHYRMTVRDVARGLMPPLLLQALKRFAGRG